MRPASHRLKTFTSVASTAAAGGIASTSRSIRRSEVMSTGRRAQVGRCLGLDGALEGAAQAGLEAFLVGAEIRNRNENDERPR